MVLQLSNHCFVNRCDKRSRRGWPGILGSVTSLSLGHVVPSQVRSLEAGSIDFRRHVVGYRRASSP